MKILFAISEAYPFAKAGGLGDFGASLPKALAQLGHEVKVLLPGYAWLRKGTPILTLDVPMGPLIVSVPLYEAGEYGGVPYYCLGDGPLFDENRVYGYEAFDETRFILFAKAVVALASADGWSADVIHCNDWHTGLIPQYAQSARCRDALGGTATVFTIHNMAYQGPLTELGEMLAGLEDDFEGNLLARGIAFADMVNTVSPRYMKEIQSPAQGEGLDGLVHSRARDLRGIINGIDYEEYDPRTDRFIAANYDASSVRRKRESKFELQALSRLRKDASAPLLGMIARLTDQKGYDLLCAGIDEIVALGAQVVVMGVGEDKYRRALADAAERHPGAVAYHALDEEHLARLIYAGADFVLAPSAFEPCGLAPLIALRYGSIPIVRRTGGMADTILDYTQDPQKGLGFTFIRKYPRHLVRTIESALEVYRDKKRWESLQRRAMTTDFSWTHSSAAYVDLYEEARERRRRKMPSGSRRRPAPAQPAETRVGLALVHHANQYLITDGYVDRQGISTIVDGYTAVLRLHERYGVPAALHLSGTLIEALAWYHPGFLGEVRRLADKGVLTLIGGGYSEAVMPLLHEEGARRSLREFLWLYERHLGRDPGDLKICWVPERVWEPEHLPGLLADKSLANGGYEWVLLDDRLRCRGVERTVFDASMSNGVKPGGADMVWANGALPDPDKSGIAYRPPDASGLGVIQISSHVRHRVPPQSTAHWLGLDAIVRLHHRAGNRDSLLVYADDMERTAGVGGWDPASLRGYDDFLKWLRLRNDVEPVHLENWLGKHGATEVTEASTGTFFELAETWKAGEEYQGWWQSPDWSDYRGYLEMVEQRLAGAGQKTADGRLLDLAWKHFVASMYETAWHDSHEGEVTPAPWAKALASHSRHALVIAEAADWFGTGARAPAAGLTDIDRDGAAEVVLRNEELMAVLTPQHGGRLVYLFGRTKEGGSLLVGNPSDDWNLQEELNRFMDEPANHPGALADVGHAHDRYEIEIAEGGQLIDMRNVEESSPMYGARKRICLIPGEQAMIACYQVPEAALPLAVGSSLSPDYYGLLREGRAGVSETTGVSWRGWRLGDACAWIGRAAGESVEWEEAGEFAVSHGMSALLRSAQAHFHVFIGAGRPTAPRCEKLMRRGIALVDGPSTEGMRASARSA